MSTTAQRNESESLVVSADEAAKLLGISRRHLWALNSSGRLPRPVRLGSRSVRWVARELSAWLDAGCPPRDRWEALKKQ